MKEKQFIFVFVPKVACTNWKCLLRYMSGYDDYLDGQIAHTRNLCGLTFLSDLSDREQLLSNSDIKKYTFVRNPFSRVLSAYMNKVEANIDNINRRSWNLHFYELTKEIDAWRIANCPSEPRLNFFSFLMWVKDSGHKHARNPHWVPQTAILHLDDVRYDFIGRFENISEDASILLSLMGCTLPFPSQEDVKFKPYNASVKLAKYYGDRELQLVTDIYKEDFELLSYSMTI